MVAVDLPLPDLPATRPTGPNAAIDISAPSSNAPSTTLAAIEPYVQGKQVVGEQAFDQLADAAHDRRP